MVGSYVSSTKHALRPHAEQQRRPTYSAPRGFSRPTVASRNHSSDIPARGRVATSADVTAGPAPCVESSPQPTHAVSSASHIDDAGLRPGDDRLDRDLILSPYWHALRMHGFECGAVLRALSAAQRLEALTLCGIEKVGHRWYVLNKYAAATSTQDAHVAGLDEQPPMPLPHTNVREHLHSPTTAFTVPPTYAPVVADPRTPDGHYTSYAAELQHANSYDALQSAVVTTVSETSPPSAHNNGAMLRRRLLRPRITQNRRRSPPSAHRKRSPSGTVDSGTVDKELLHPPEDDDEGSLPSRAADPEPLGTPDRPTAVRPERTIPIPQHGSVDGPWGSKDGSNALWGAVSAAPITSLHDGAAYKTLVTLLGKALEPRSYGQRPSAPRRRSTSPGDQSSAGVGSSDWVVEAARRRFLASPSSASTPPLTPFFLSR